MTRLTALFSSASRKTGTGTHEQISQINKVTTAALAVNVARQCICGTMTFSIIVRRSGCLCCNLMTCAAQCRTSHQVTAQTATMSDNCEFVRDTGAAVRLSHISFVRFSSGVKIKSSDCKERSVAVIGLLHV